jgi:hypothetical protein
LLPLQKKKKVFVGGFPAPWLLQSGAPMITEKHSKKKKFHSILFKFYIKLNQIYVCDNEIESRFLFKQCHLEDWITDVSVWMYIITTWLVLSSPSGTHFDVIG